MSETENTSSCKTLEEHLRYYFKRTDAIKCNSKLFKSLATQCIKDDWEELKSNSSKKIFIVRHGERVDFTFGDWIPYYFKKDDEYERSDLNLPVQLPKRVLGSSGYFDDTPITQIGIYQAILVGEKMKSLSIQIDQVYSSPAFRCIQTCNAILQGLGKKNDLKIKVEPGLFDCKIFYKQSLPNFLSTEELLVAGYNIDTTYKPIILQDDLAQLSNKFEEYYKLTSNIVESTINAGIKGNVLLLGHGLTADVYSHILLELPNRTGAEFLDRAIGVPYLATLILANKGNGWNIIKAPYMSITHDKNEKWNIENN